MITKNSLKSMKKVKVAIWSDEGKFANGNITKRITVYDATSDEVYNKVLKVLSA